MNYTTNEEILQELKDYKKTGEMSEELGVIIIKIMRGLASKGNFYGYTWKDDMVAEGILTTVKYLKNFDPEKSQNPFAYITKIGYMAFISYIKKQKKHCEIKKICYEFHEQKMEGNYKEQNVDYTDLQHIKPKEI